MPAQPILPSTQTVVRLMRRPQGAVVPGTDLVVSQEATQLQKPTKKDHLRLHRLYLSLDPAMRGWMNDIPSYIPPVKLGAVMRGATVCEVLESNSTKYKKGDFVLDNATSRF